MFDYKNYIWQREWALIISAHEDLRNKALAALLVYQSSNKKRRYTKKQYWIHPMLQKRRMHGFYHIIYPIITLHEGTFRNYFRMSKVQFEELAAVVAPKIAKQSAVRETISAPERLCLTIRYLASGDSMASMSYQYLIGLTTINNIIAETCQALVEEVLPHQLTPNEWLKISSDFENQWNFPHCIGAIDGKHVEIQRPDNSGSEFFNYKHSHSIILLGICDANYKFTFVDIGAYGRRSDGGVLKDSLIGQKFHANAMNLPNPQPISTGGPPVPYVLVGDEAFQLTNFHVRPYPGKGGLNQERKIHNYRLCRSRRTIENTFGILANKWRILRRPIICDVEKCTKIVQATVCLHNWLKQRDTEVNQYVPPTLIDQDNPDGIIPGYWRRDGGSNNFLSIGRSRNNNSTRAAVNIRNEFCRYYSSEGAVYWQFDHC